MNLDKFKPNKKKVVTMSLDIKTIDYLKKIGGGKLSIGIEIAAAFLKDKDKKSK
jgi:hypothetical protein